MKGYRAYEGEGTVTVEDEIRALLVTDLGLRGSGEVASDFPLIDKGLLDSMGIFQLVGALEARFGFHVADEDIVAENFESIAAIARLVTSKEA